MRASSFSAYWVSSISFKRCKAVAAEAHFFSGAIAHIWIVWIMKFLEEDEVRNGVSTPRRS